MTSSVVWLNELHVPPADDSAARARQFVRNYCADQDLPELADDVQLVVSELVTNAVVHARTRIRVRIEELPSCVKLTVYDEAVDRPVPSLARRVLDEDESGRGLWLVDACTADWGTDVTGQEGKSTWAIFPVSSSPSERRAAVG